MAPRIKLDSVIPTGVPAPLAGTLRSDLGFTALLLRSIESASALSAVAPLCFLSVQFFSVLRGTHA